MWLGARVVAGFAGFSGGVVWCVCRKVDAGGSGFPARGLGAGAAAFCSLSRPGRGLGDCHLHGGEGPTSPHRFISTVIPAKAGQARSASHGGLALRRRTPVGGVPHHLISTVIPAKAG